MAEELRILMVEDLPSDAELIEYALRREGLRFSLRRVETEGTFLKELGGFAPDLIISDYHLPQFDGMTALRLAKEHAPDTPVIMATIPVNEDTAVECMKAGADDYIIKDRLARFGPAVKAVLERKREQEENRHTAEALDEAQHAMRIARDIQRNLYPRSAPAIAGFDVAGASYPAEFAGGDYFDYISLPDGSILIGIGDVSGHGIAAALIMASAHASIRALVGHSETDVTAVLKQTNTLLSATVPENHFFTVALARLDPGTQCFLYQSAGHERGYILDADGQVKTVLESTAIPLICEPDMNFAPTRKVRFEPGELLLLTTDGVRESGPIPGPRFGAGRTIEVVRANRERPASEIVDILFQAVCDYCAPKPPIDDVSVIIAKVDDIA